VTTFLLDVNVLVALFDPAHVHHDLAHDWFGAIGKKAWATCPITENGVVRVLSHPKYPTVTATPAEIIGRLGIFCGSPGHVFWPDDVSLTDGRLFRADHIAGPKKVTDVYLAGLAANHGGRLATFDRAILAGAMVTTSRIVELIDES
jgi:toxin-antitoxin system PIN domain toxin